MNKETVDKLCEDAEDHIYVARKCINRGDYATAEKQLCGIMTGYSDYFSASTDEASEQQQDDSEDKGKADDKGCVGDSPHSGHVTGL